MARLVWTASSCTSRRLPPTWETWRAARVMKVRRTAVHLQRGREPIEPINGQIALQRGYWDKRTFLRLRGLPVPGEP
jgi:hypothetical protein